MDASEARKEILSLGFKLIKDSAYSRRRLSGYAECPVCFDWVYYKINVKTHRMTARCGNRRCIRMKE